MTEDTGFPDVPAAAPDAVADPLFEQLLEGGRSTLPDSYLPAMMPTQVDGWRRLAVWIVLAMLVATLMGGICLTYGFDELFTYWQS